jgi:hypothetical protein
MAETIPLAVLWFCKKDEWWPEHRKLLVESNMVPLEWLPETRLEWNAGNEAGKVDAALKGIIAFETEMSPVWVRRELQARRCVVSAQSVLDVLYNPLGIKLDGFDRFKLR